MLGVEPRIHPAASVGARSVRPAHALRLASWTLKPERIEKRVRSTTLKLADLIGDQTRVNALQLVQDFFPTPFHFLGRDEALFLKRLQRPKALLQ